MNIATFNKTAVSLGLGRIERAILAIVDVEDEYEQTYAAETWRSTSSARKSLILRIGGPPRTSMLRSYAPRIRWRIDFRSGLR